MKYIIIVEIGTNSIKAVVGVIDFHKLEFINEKIYYTRLGEKLATAKYLSYHAMSHNIAVLHELIDEYQRIYSTVEIFLLATQVLRTALNYQIFIQKVKLELGFEIIILSSREEAMCAFYSQYNQVFSTDLPMLVHFSNCGVLDIGGGSTELVYQNENHVLITQSFPLGAVFLKEKKALTSLYPFSIKDGKEHLTRFLKQINHIIQECVHSRILFKGEYLTVIGGTAVALAYLHKSCPQFNSNLLEGTILTIADIEAAYVKFINFNDHTILPGRADILPYGIAILLFFLAELKLEKIVVSCKGVRHGYLVMKTKIINLTPEPNN